MSDHDAHPTDELDPDEPHTPLWLPLLGGVLLLLVVVFALATNDDEPAGAALDGATQPANAAQPE